MNTLELGQLTIGDIPRVVGTISSGNVFKNLDTQESLPCDIVEVRLDALNPSGDWWLEKCSLLESLGYPIILTIRAKNEGGNWQGSDEERVSIFLRALPYISVVDIELSNGVSSKLRTHVAEHNVKLLISYHNFSCTPPLNELLEKIDGARLKGADIVKIATMINSPQDIAILSTLTSSVSQESPICVIGMGSNGVSTRITLTTLGSVLTYGYLDMPSAPGQLPCSMLCQSLRKLIPQFNEDIIIRNQILEYV